MPQSTSLCEISDRNALIWFVEQRKRFAGLFRVDCLDVFTWFVWCAWWRCGSYVVCMRGSPIRALSGLWIFAAYAALLLFNACIAQLWGGLCCVEEMIPPGLSVLSHPSCNTDWGVLFAGEFMGGKPVGVVKAIGTNLYGCSTTSLLSTLSDVRKPVESDPKDGELSVIRMKGV